MEIRLRAATETRSAHLTNIPLDQLDTVIPTIQSWGIASAEGDPADLNGLSGQFVYDATTNVAYFEVLIGDDE